jgi:PIN like domain/Protein of unknown function (DUF433)
VTIDPDHAFGRPRFVHGGSAVDNVIDLFRAGEPVDAVPRNSAYPATRSRTRSMSQPEQRLRFFLDRSLRRKAVPEALRADGWDVITLAEHYGMPADEQVADTDWIEEAA